MLLFSAFFIAMIVTMALIPPLMRLAYRMSVVDTPNERKVHTGIIPRIGGMAMIVGAAIPVLLWLPHNTLVAAILLALLVLLVFGAWDDSRNLDYRIKFLGQFVAVLIVVLWGDVRIRVFPFAGIEPIPDYLSTPISVIFLVGVTNAVNLSDGLDGLAAGVTLLSLGAISLLATLADGHNVILICFTIAGAIFGFLRYNTYPARIFMGDTGSQFLGFSIGVLSILLTQQVNTALNSWLPLFLVGLPILDTLYVMVKRISEGHSPFIADRNHLHHRLLNLGMAHYEAVSVIYMLQLVFVLSAFYLRYQSDMVVFVAYLGIMALIFGGMWMLQGAGRKVAWGRLTRHVTSLEKSQAVQRLALGALHWGVPLLLLAGVILLSQVPRDISISSLIIMLIFLARLVWARYLRFFPLRLLVFPSVAFAVYLINRDQRLMSIFQPTVWIALLAVMLVLMLLVIRSTKDQTFQTTPTDLLVVALAGGVGVLYQQGMIEAALVPVVLGIVVLFYASELVMRHMRSTWNGFTLGMIAVLAVLSLKLL